MTNNSYINDRVKVASPCSLPRQGGRISREACAVTERIDYDGLAELSRKLGRPIGTLVALGYDSDPFYADMPSRRTAAEWFARIWQRFGFGRGAPLRRIHYQLISQETPVLDHRGSQYENTVNCWTDLKSASGDARLLGLVPIEFFEDRRADHPFLNLYNAAANANLSITGLAKAKAPSFRAVGWVPNLPDFDFTSAVIDQRYHLEIWVEKSTVNDVLVPLCDRYQINLVTGSGDLSLTHCHQLIERALYIGRPVRILYVSDFDRDGVNKPVGLARNIEFLIQQRQLDLDLQVRPVALTLVQCQRYRLPRTPVKEMTYGKAEFEGRFGEGATELDALEALCPGELRRVLLREIERYHDRGLNDRVQETADAVKERLAERRREIIAPHEEKLEELRAEHRSLAEECNAELRPIFERYDDQFAGIAERFNSLQGTITSELRERAPDLDAIDWPQPEHGDDDDDALFDSTRGYVEQIDRYKARQDKPTEKKIRSDAGTTRRKARRRR
jgi:hypothetical protein